LTAPTPTRASVGPNTGMWTPEVGIRLEGLRLPRPTTPGLLLAHHKMDGGPGARTKFDSGVVFRARIIGKPAARGYVAMVPYIPVGRGRVRSSALYYYREDVINVWWCNVLSENIRRVGMEPREGLDGAVRGSRRAVVERCPGPGQSASWAGPLSALNVGSAGSKPAGVGCNLTVWMHPLAAFSQLACSHSFAGPASIVISPKCQNRIMDMLQCACFEGTIERADE